jgi:hypothetical protein
MIDFILPQKPQPIYKTDIQSQQADIALNDENIQLIKFSF